MGVVLKLLQRVLFIIQFTILLVSCNSESPEISYTGISTDSAVHLARTSNTNTKIVALLNRVKDDPEPGFDWTKFWTEISELKLFAKMNMQTRNMAVAMFELNCDQSAKNAQAKIIYEYPEFYRTVVGGQSNCQTLLSNDIFAQFFEKMANEVIIENNNKHLLAQTLVEMVNRRMASSDSETVGIQLSKYSERQWKEFVEQLIKEKSPQHVGDFIVFYEKIYGSSSLVYLLIDDLLSDGQFFQEFVTVMGLVKALEILLRVPTNLADLSSVSEENWKSIGDYLVSQFLEVEFAGNSIREQLKTKLITFQNLEIFFNSVERKIDSLTLLGWSDSVFRSLERSLQSFDKVEGLLEEFELNLQLALLRQRLLLNVTEEEVAEIKASPRFGSNYEKLNLLRLQIYVASDPKEVQVAISRYCEQMESTGVEPTTVSPSKFKADFLRQAGCFYLEPTPGLDSVLDFSGQAVVSSIYSVLLTDGTSLTGLSEIDISVLDASSYQNKPDLPEEPPLPGDHALVMPVSFGIRLIEDTELLDKGIYYIPFHFIQRRATDGRKAVANASQGYSGGSVQIPPSSDFLKTKVISVGGEGQRPVPPRRGGDGDISVFSWILFEELITLQEEAQSEKVRSLLRPTISLLDYLLENAELSENGESIKIYVNSLSLLDSLDEVQRQKIKSFCEEKFSEITECIYDLSQQAALQMNAALEDAKGVRNDSYVLPQMASEEFRLPPGKPGSPNPKGMRGDRGVISNVELVQ